MNNFQLYKTSVLLGGQMKLDLVLDFKNDYAIIKDFHITPISKYVPYNRHSDQNLLKYNHQDNIRDFYKKTVSSFYETFSSPQMNHNWPIVDESKSYDDIFFAGCSRSDYNTYGTQFEYFCPLWLEQINSDDYISFNIELKLKDKDKVIATKKVDLKYIDNPRNDKDVLNHNKFVKYINNYFNYIGILGDGCDNVINIDLLKQTAHLRGLEVTSGNMVTKNLNELVYNLMVRERPLLESDYIITTSFENTKTILPNLFNFNLCFNMEDIFSSGIVNQLMGKPLYVNVSTQIIKGINKYNSLEKRDLYTNYEYIKKKYYKVVGEKDSPEYIDKNIDNVLNYLHDDKYINHMDKNKIVQKVPHWQLVDNDKYIFNIYEGFSGFFTDENEPVRKYAECYNRYADTPDVIQSRYSKSLNNTGWANIISDMDLGKYNSFIKSNKITSDFTCIKNGWVGYLYYNGDKKINVLLGYVTDDKQIDKIKNNSNKDNSYYYPEEDTTTVISVLDKFDDSIVICSKKLNDLTFAGIKNIIKDVKGIEAIHNLSSMMNSLRPLSLIYINNSLGIIYADSPSKDSKEIDYKKINNHPIYMLRYDGKIKPNMINPEDEGMPKNFIYNKIYLKNTEGKSFEKYSESKYPPLYPSIGYWSLENEEIDYNTPSECVKKNIEYKWFNSSKILYTVPELRFNINIYVDKNENVNINDVNDEIIKKIKDNMNIDIDTSKYIFNLYKISYDLKNFSSENNKDMYNYDIIMKFK